MKTPSSGSIYLVNRGNWNFDTFRLLTRLMFPVSRTIFSSVNTEAPLQSRNGGREWFGFVEKEARLTDENQMARATNNTEPANF